MANSTTLNTVLPSKLDPKVDQTWIVHGLKDLSLDQQDQVCGQCHARMSSKSFIDTIIYNLPNQVM